MQARPGRGFKSHYPVHPYLCWNYGIDFSSIFWKCRKKSSSNANKKLKENNLTLQELEKEQRAKRFSKF
jgi:hypothetical protein